MGGRGGMANRDFDRGGSRDRDYGEPYGRSGYYGRPYGGTEREGTWGAEPEGYGREGYGREGWRGGEWEGGRYGARDPYFRSGYGGGYTSYYGREGGRGAPFGGGSYGGDYAREGGPSGYYGGYGGYYGREPYDRFDRERFDVENFGWGGGYGGAYSPGSYRAGWGPQTIGRESYFGRGPRGYRRSDERIREEVNDRLTWHAAVDASDIEVRVEDGEVTLTGVVEDRRAKRLAADIAEEVMGVQDVHNQLKIRHGFLAGLTGEKAEEREVSRSAEREATETTGRRGTRTGATAGATAGTTTGATPGGSATEAGRRGT
jgi:hypothetical protein